MLFEFQSVLNKHFDANFSLCPVEYEGIRFNTPADREWISLHFLPEDADEGKENGLVRVICYSSSATLAFSLAADVKKFLDNAFIEGVDIGVGRGDGLGAINLENGIWQTVLLFDIMAVNVKCEKD